MLEETYTGVVNHTWVKWTLGVIATVVASLVVAGFIDYMTLRDQVRTLSSAGGIDAVISVRQDIGEVRSQIERIRERLQDEGGVFTHADGEVLRQEIIREIASIESKVSRIENRVDSLHGSR